MTEAIYDRLVRESRGQGHAWEIARREGDPRVCVGSKRGNHFTGLVVTPLPGNIVPGDVVEIRCICVYGGMEVVSPVDRMTATIADVIVTHECEPWPG